VRAMGLNGFIFKIFYENDIIKENKFPYKLGWISRQIEYFNNSPITEVLAPCNHGD
jgi:hypothetical protein